MTTIPTKTNILRLQTSSPCYCYHSTPATTIQQQDILQIESFLEQLDNNIIYSHPHLYTNNQLLINEVDVLLSRGDTVRLRLDFVRMRDKGEIVGEIGEKIMRGLGFMMYRKIRTCFNPFQQTNATIPGLYMQALYEQDFTAIAFLPVNLTLQPPIEISSAKILLNYSTGSFYQVKDIVRVDKLKNLLHFRNGTSVSISSLKKCNVKEVSGLVLADRLRNCVARVKDTCGKFMSNWGVCFQGSFYNRVGTLIPAGTLALRDGKEKALVELVMPMARNTYNHNYRQFFKSCSFESVLQSQLIFIIPNTFPKQSKQILHEFQKQSQKMSLPLKLSHTTISSLQSRDDLYKAILSTCVSNSAIYILLASKHTNTLEEENIGYFKEEMISKEFYFHVLRFDAKEEADEVDIVVHRNLAVLYAKMRLTPWRIKNIPFGDRPTTVCNVDVTDAGDGKFSIAAVVSMNSFFSKFCCSHSICPSADRIQPTIFALIQKSLNKFCSIHKIYPFRIFIYRTGIIVSMVEEQKFVRSRLASYYQSINYTNSSTVTYVQIKKSHPIRTYLQSDQNNISKWTVKKTQLLLCIQISNKYYLQLEFDEAPIQIQIYQQENDPGFVNKILELTAKLAFGSVGNQFGKGVGFLGYAGKLNTYRQFKLQKWEKYLNEGVMLFL